MVFDRLIDFYRGAVVAGTRRTQAERVAETRGLLIDATIQTIVEAGYARVTVKEVCRRAGVSHGGLFGRFETLADLVAAAAAEVGRRLMAKFVASMEQLPDRGDVSAVLALWRDAARDPLNTVWLELTVAARTDSQLRERLQSVRADYASAMLKSGSEMRAVRGLPPERIFVLGSIVGTLFDGDAIHSGPFPQPELDAPRLEVLTAMMRHYLESERSPRE
ncbi:TetR/AcrR family transcriptional regulator [Nocardia huaxiensis]|uniref:TetR/AcrR family transcriptional regulator n=1 Tax=Nocardia huaxiensis TaxID=2755382 RepID=A0A7D6VMK5_9NOCA|nr:TetR/AcrR family transcriptional regulator [Nocardia huaxiensis]